MNIWSRLGLSVAIAALFCIGATELLQSRRFFELYKWYICAMFLASGAVLWLVGRSLNARFAKGKTATQEPGDETGADEESGGGPSSPPFNLAYWGPMLSVFGSIIVFIHPQYVAPAKIITARAKPARMAPPTKAPPETNSVPTVTNKPAVFPSLKLQGLIYHPPNPSAIINGRTYFVGDYVGEAKVFSIDEHRAVLEQDGSFKVLELGK